MDESFSTHYQTHHLNSVVASSYLKGGGISEVLGGYLRSTGKIIF